MANGFVITISATDRASKTIGLINKHLQAMQAPAKRLQGELRKFGDLTGIRSVGQSIESVGRSLVSVVPGLAALTGAATIGGFAALIENTVKFNSALGYSAQRMGVLPEYLANLRGASELAGGSADAAQSGFDNLGQTLYDVANGQAPQAAYILSRLGLSLTDSAGHARQAADVFPELADAVAGIKNPLAQARLATMLFGSAGADMLPMLRLGSKGIAELEKRSGAYTHTTNDAAGAAQGLVKAQAALHQSFDGVTNALTLALAPALTPLLTDFANWISNSADAKEILANLTGGIRDFGRWLKDTDFRGIAKDVDADVQAFGGWKTILEGLVAIRLASWASGAIGPIGGLLRLLALVPGSGVTAAALPALAAGAAGAAVAVPLAYGLKSGLDYIDPRSGSRANMRAGTRGSDLGPRHGAPSPPPAPHPSAPPAMLLPPVTPIAPAPVVPKLGAGTPQQQALAFFQGSGWNKAQSAGLVANLLSESSLNPHAVGDGGHAYGIGQWHEDRQVAFAKFAGHDIRNSTLAEQLGFVNSELQNSERGAGKKLHAANDAREAGAIISRYYERPAARDEAAANRGALAERLYAENGPAGKGTSGKVEVTIRLAGAAPDKVITRASGDVNVAVAHAMPAAGKVA